MANHQTNKTSKHDQVSAQTIKQAINPSRKQAINIKQATTIKQSASHHNM
jgi:hypothetical protein